MGSVLTLKSTGKDVEERECVDFIVYRGRCGKGKCLFRKK